MRSRFRDLGFAIGHVPTGPGNAITDVPGVRVGHTTLIEGDGPLVVGEGPVRTGVTAILPPIRCFPTACWLAPSCSTAPARYRA
jgi:D-aminopeptidase